MAHTRVRQTIENIPVWEGEAIVHLKSDGELSEITDNLKGSVAVSTEPNLSAKEALKIAQGDSRRAKKMTEDAKVDLWIYRGEMRDHLAYRVEMPRLDGTKETATTTQYDKLFVEVRNTSGILLATPATYSNLNKGTAGVYSQKSLNLSAYKGQTVRVQFRSTMDGSITTTFRVDDASLK